MISSKKHSKNIEIVIDAENRANRLRAEANVSRAVGKSSFLGDISADNAAIRARKEKDELEKKIRAESNRFKDETVIRFLQFSNNDYLVMSHLSNYAVKAIENKIEGKL